MYHWNSNVADVRNTLSRCRLETEPKQYIIYAFSICVAVSFGFDMQYIDAVYIAEAKGD